MLADVTDFTEFLGSVIYINEAQHMAIEKGDLCTLLLMIRSAVNTIIEAWDRHEDVLSCYDLSKAFDMINVDVLLDQLQLLLWN